MKLKTPSPFVSRVLSLGLAASALLSGVAGHAGAQSTRRADARRDAASAERLPLLSRYATELAKQERGDAKQTRAAEIRRAVEILSRDTRNSAILVGDSADAALAVARGVASRAAAGRVPSSLRGAGVFALDATQLRAGAPTEEEFASRLRSVIEEAAGARGRAVLFTPDLRGLLEGYGSRTAAESLRASLSRGELRVIAAAAPEAFDAQSAADADLLKLFQPVRLGEDEEPASRDEDETADAAFAGDRLSADLRELAESAKPNERVGVILQAEDVQNPRLEALLRKHGVEVGSRMSQVGALRVEVPAGALRELAESGEARYLSPDRAVRSLGHVTATTGTDAMRAISGNGALDGSGVAIAVIDSGLDVSHKTFAMKTDLSGSRVKFKKDFTAEGKADKDPYGHGTHVASSAAGMSTVAGGGYEGVARGADIINLRVLDSNGQGKSSDLLAALNWILSPADPNKPLSSSNPTNATKYNVRVVNLSLGTPAVDSYRNDPLCKAVRKIVDAGIVVVAAAGNTGKDSSGNKVYGLIHSPGNEPSAITVGAANTFGTDARSDDGIATYSSRGPTRSYYTDSNGLRHYDNLIKPDLCAPGNKLIFAEADDGGGNRNLIVRQNPQLDSGLLDSDNKRLMYLSGTSMATPLVAGAAAVMLEANPKLTPNMVKMILMYTAQQLAGFNQLEQGAGELNVEGAVRLARLVRQDLPAPAAQGAPLLSSLTLPTPATAVAGQTFAWSQGVILKQRIATGTNLIVQYQNVYGLGMVLGDGILMSDGMILGDGMVLGDGIMMADQITTSSGMVLGDGTPFMSCGILMSDGIMMTDGMVLGDGILMSDGMILGDGILMADSALEAMSAQVGGDDTPSMK